MIEMMKIIVGVTFGLIFILMAVKTRSVKPPMKMLLFILMEFIISVILVLLTFWAINMSFKKAIITEVQNTRVLSSETIIVTGYVRNVGKYNIANAILDVKILNAVSGKAKEPAKNRDGSEKISTLERSFIIAKNLRPGEQRRFRASMKYPPHFRLTDVRTHLTWN